jgi:AraC-like DNA-binding protein
MAAAVTLLLNLPKPASGAPVLDVAFEHGYRSPSAFAAMFRLPSEWRRVATSTHPNRGLDHSRSGRDLTVDEPQPRGL